LDLELRRFAITAFLGVVAFQKVGNYVRSGLGTETRDVAETKFPRICDRNGIAGAEDCGVVVGTIPVVPVLSYGEKAQRFGRE